MGGRAYAHIRDNFVGYLVLFALLTTGTAQAVDGPLPGTNQVGSEDIIKNEVRSADIADGRIFNLDIADDIIQSGKIRDGTLAGTDVGANALTTDDISDSRLFNDRSLTTGDIDESTLFNDNSLTATDLAPNSVGASEISAGAVRGSDIIDNSVTAADIGAGQVGSREIPADSVRASELTLVTRDIASAEISPGEEDALTVLCGPGDAAIGGEAIMEEDGIEGPRTYASFPVTSDFRFPAEGQPFTGWRGLFKNEERVTLSAFVYVICLEG